MHSCDRGRCLSRTRLLCALLWLACPAMGATTTPGATPQAPALSKPQDPLHRESPQSCVHAFLDACQAKNYAQAAKYLDLQSLPAQERLKDSDRLVQQLEQILDRDGQFDVASLSREPGGDETDGLSPDRERVDSFQRQGRSLELQLKRVKLRSGVSVWLFSADTVTLIPTIARLVTDSPLERYMPDFLVTWKVLDTSLWQWLALGLLAAGLLAVSGVLSRRALLLAEPLLKRLVSRVTSEELAVFAGPLRLLLCIVVFRAGMEWVGMSALVRLYLERTLAVLFFYALACAGVALVDVFIGRFRTVLAARRSTLSYSALPLVSRALKLIIWLLAITTVLSVWGYNTTTILAGLGVGGLAVALAAQKTIENLFGGVAVISDRPVFVGDLCRFGDRIGTVEDIGLRSTRIRTPDRTLVTVPNGQFSSMTLENLSKRDKTLFHLTLNLRRDTTPQQVRKVLQSIKEILKSHKEVASGPLPVRFVGVGTYSLDLEVFAYVMTQDGDEFLETQQELLLSILDAVEAAGTELALPTQASISYSSPAANGHDSGQRGPKLMPGNAK